MKLLLAFAFLAFVSAAPLYTRTAAPEGWTLGSPAPSAFPVSFTLALRQNNLPLLNEIFNEVTNPEHESYQEYLSIEAIRALIAPEQEEVDTVRQWLEIHGVSPAEVKDMGDALEVRTTVLVASKLFKTKFHIYTHDETNNAVVKSFGEYSVPDALDDIVELVVGIANFPVPHLKTIRGGPANDDQGVVPQTCNKLYNIGEHNSTGFKQGQSVVEFQGQSFSPDDLTSFGTKAEVPVDNPSSDHIVGPNLPSAPGTEAQLDIQSMAGIDNDADQWFWLESGNGWLYVFATHIFGYKDAPLVNSISYGWSEADQCRFGECNQLGVNDQGYVARVNTEFQKIGLRGLSLLASSGDSGANGRTDGLCLYPYLIPAFPAASPFVTAVGATQLNNPTPLSNPPNICSGFQCADGGEEVAVSYDVSGFASGGGFSLYTAQPAYQFDAVAGYLKNSDDLPPAKYFNASNRGFPDIAALGHNILIVNEGMVQGVGGTSASCPINGAIISLLNEVAFTKTGKPLGFLNPLLYKMAAECPKCFQDITVGDNHCTEQGCGIGGSCKGYKCAVGWDPVTGLGSLNFGAMKDYIMSNL